MTDRVPADNPSSVAVQNKLAVLTVLRSTDVELTFETELGRLGSSLQSDGYETIERRFPGVCNFVYVQCTVFSGGA
jgi:hypothetical protein